MSGDQLDLDAITDNITHATLAQDALGKGLPVTASRLLRLAEALDDAEALVAEVRRLRALEARLGEIPGQWIASTADGLGYRHDHWRGPDYAEGVDAGVEGCADVLRRTLAGE